MEKLSRRDAIRLVVVTVAGAALAACGETPTVTPTSTRIPKSPATPTVPATKIPDQPRPTRIPEQQSPTPVLTPKRNTPTALPETTKVSVSQEVKIINETGGEILRIKPAVLQYFLNEIKSGGLTPYLTVHIRNSTDEVFPLNKVPGYEATINQRGPDSPLAKTVCHWDAFALVSTGKKGCEVYLLNSQEVDIETIDHEKYHIMDPDVNSAIRVDVSDFDMEYWQRFLAYLNELPTISNPDGAYAFDYERQLITLNEKRVGEKYWSMFTQKLQRAGVIGKGIDVNLPFSVSDTLSNYAIEKLPEDSLVKQALMWWKNIVETISKHGEKPLKTGFTDVEWGQFLIWKSLTSYGNVVDDLSLLEEIKSNYGTPVYSLSRKEAWAELGRLRKTNASKAASLFQKGVRAQERVEKMLKANSAN